MKRTVKRVCALAAASLLALSMALMCSCEKKIVYKNEPITLPLEKTYTLSMWMNFDNAYMQDYASYGDHPFYKWLETKTNIHIDFQTPTSTANDIGQLRGEWINRVAAGDMTEMVEHYYFVPDIEGNTLDSAADEEMYYILNEYIDVQMDNFKALQEEYVTINKLLITPYNNIMYIPKLTGIEDDNKGAPITQGLVIRKDFLDEIQEDVPVTIADWERVLSKMQTGIGIKYPLMFGDMPLDATLTGDPFLSAYGVSYKFHINKDTGLLDYGCISDGMKQYVQLLNNWYRQGLLSTLKVTRDMKLSDDAGAFYATVDELISLNSDTNAANPNYELVACPYPVLNEGDIIDVYDTYMPTGNKECNSIFITYACESPALAAKWIDQLFSEESYNRASYGELNTDYTVTEDGSVSYTDKIMQHEKGSIVGVYENCLPTAMFCDRDALVNLLYTAEQLESVKTWSNVTRDRSVIRTTSMTMTAEEEEMMEDFGNFWAIQTMNLKGFITATGETGKDISEWDDFVAEMNDAGMQEYIMIEQAAWDRYLAN